VALYATVIAAVPLIATAQEVEADIAEVGGVPTNMIMWSALVGFFLPLAIEVPKRQTWPSWVKGLFAFACCLLAAAGTAFFSGTLQNFRDIATASLFVTFTALGSYKLLWKSSGISEKINNATN
jgi:drug/metabolite transporter (DMT)-like permease